MRGACALKPSLCPSRERVRRSASLQDMESVEPDLPVPASVRDLDLGTIPLRDLCKKPEGRYVIPSRWQAKNKSTGVKEWVIGESWQLCHILSWSSAKFISASPGAYAGPRRSDLVWTWLWPGTDLGKSGPRPC